MSICAYAFAPSNALEITKTASNYVTKAKGGNGVIFEISMELLRIFDSKRYERYMLGKVNG